MFALICLAVVTASNCWYLPPVAAVISLVYYASRFEAPRVIITRAVRLFITIMLFMGVIFLLLWGLSFNL